MRKIKMLQVVLCLILAAASFVFYGNLALAAASDGAVPAKKGQGEMKMATKDQGRVTLSAQKQEALFGKKGAPKAAQDPEFNNTMNRLIYGEIYQQGNFTDRQRELGKTCIFKN